MKEETAINQSGTPKEETVYAVFGDERAARGAEEALRAFGVEPAYLRGPDQAQMLKEPADEGVGSHIERWLKTLGGESHEAQRYGEHLDHGRVVLVVPAPDRDTAVALTDLLTSHGAFDVTYYSGWTIEHTSWQDDAARGLPTYTTTNTEPS